MLNLHYKQLVTVTLLLLSGILANTAAAEPRINSDRDMFANQQLASDKQIPVMLMFSAEECPYCEILESEVLRPMLISGDYGHKVLIRRFMIDDGGNIRDFDGKMIDNYEFVSRYNIFVTPTLVFLDANGQELAERIIGVNTLELFAGRVDDAILASLNSLRGTNLTRLDQHQEISPRGPSAKVSLSRERAGD